MTAAATDLLQEVGIATATTLDANYTIGDATVTVVSTTGMPTATGITFAIDQVDSGGTQVAGTYNEYVGVVASATSITNVSHQNGTNQNYTAGATTRVYLPVSAERENRIVEWGLVEHEQDGTHAVELITSRTEDTSPASGDFILTSDVSASNALKKVTLNNLATNIPAPSGSSLSTGWWSLGDAPETVTYNGNRSYSLVFNGEDHTDQLSNGMRLKLTRTVTAPTQCADLESGSSHYFSRASASLSGITFTDDFVVSAWVKLESYAQMTIASRFNGTSGWLFYLANTGQLVLDGYNAGGANFSRVISYQSVPLNKWLHVTAQLDMSAFTATTTTSYVMFDGVDVPASVTRGGTNPTALVQAGDLEIGAYNGATAPFDGKIAQVAIYSAKVTQANIRATISQGLAGTETSLAAAYSFNNSIEDLTSNNNDLTAQNSAVATATDSPFSGGSGGTTEYAIITANTFSTNTTLTVQVPEGYAIPTSGGVSAVSYSTQKVPYGFPSEQGKWLLRCVYKSQTSTAINNTTAQLTGAQISLPAGGWFVGHRGAYAVTNSGVAYLNATIGLSTSTSSITDDLEGTEASMATLPSSLTEVDGCLSSRQDYSVSSQTTLYLNGRTSQNNVIYYAHTSPGVPTQITAELALL